jgi:phospholipid-binding lipoprotein MlaA
VTPEVTTENADRTPALGQSARKDSSPLHVAGQREERAEAFCCSWSLPSGCGVLQYRAESKLAPRICRDVPGRDGVHGLWWEGRDRLSFSQRCRTLARPSTAGLASAWVAAGLALVLGGVLGCASAPPGREPVPLAAQAGAPVDATQDALAADSQAPRPPGEAEDALIASIQKGPYDPLEPVNRGFFALNRGIDYVLLDPFTTAYEFVVPVEGRRAVRRVFRNLSSARTLANDILQLEFRDAIVTTARFAINTTLGLGGLFDPAANFGLARHESDFGETLARAGMGAGPYLVLPLFGPTTFRDGVGSAVDGFLEPQFWLLGPGSRLLLNSGDGLSLRDEHQGDLRHLQESAVDYYAALRSAYLLDREGEIRGREKSEDAPFSAKPFPEGTVAPSVSEPAPSAPPQASEGSEAETAPIVSEPPAVGAETPALLKPAP